MTSPLLDGIENEAADDALHVIGVDDRMMLSFDELRYENERYRAGNLTDVSMLQVDGVLWNCDLL